MVARGEAKGNDGGASGCVPLSVRAILPPMTPGSGLSPNLHHLETSATIAISQEAKRRKAAGERSEEHTSELQSPCNLVCRLLLEKKKKTVRRTQIHTPID